MPSKKIERVIELTIKHMQNGKGLINFASDHYYKEIIDKDPDLWTYCPMTMKSLGLIEIANPIEPHVTFGQFGDSHSVCKLTDYGWKFKSFAHERRKKWKENNPFLNDAIVVFIGAALSLLTGYILWRIDNQAKRQELLEIQQQVQKVKGRIDSLTKIPTYHKDSTNHK